MAEKKKNTNNRLGTIPFTVLWTLAYGLGWATLIFGGIITNRFFPEVFRWFPDFVYMMLGVGVPAFIYTLAQQFLIRWKFAVKLRWWFLWSTIAATLAGGSLQVLNSIDLPNITNPIIGITLVLGYAFAVPAIAQAWALRHEIKRSWLWPLAAIASASTFAVPIASNSFISSEWALMGLLGVAGLMQGAVMAITLIWLFGMTRVEPLKRGLDNAQMQQAENNLTHQDEAEDDEEYEEVIIIKRRRSRQKIT